MIKDSKYIRRISRFGFHTFGTITGVFSTGFLMEFLGFSEEDRVAVIKRYLDNWGLNSLADVDYKVSIDDKSVYNNGENFLFLSNHQSLLDVLTILATAPQSIRFVAKKSIFKIPVFSHAMRYVGMFEIDRKNKKTAIETLEYATKKLKNGFNSIVMFPEGTRNREGNEPLLPFKKGAFYLAIEAGVSIIPVSITNSKNLLPVDTWKVEPGKIKIHYGKPIETKGMTIKDIPKLMETVRAAITENLDY